MTSRSSAKKGDVLILLGTRKGAFILNSDQTRKNWTMAGPYCAGSEVFHMVYDQREGGRVFAASNSMIWGPEFQFSDNLGQSWASAETQPKFSGDGGPTVKNLWHVELGRDAEPGVLYVGVEPAALFKSEAGGKNWLEVKGLSNHKTYDQWQPGLGGLCLHSIVLDPTNLDRARVGISAVGVFRTTDGGESWHTKNQGVRADFLPDPFPEIGQCHHKVLIHPSQPEVVYQQNHCGVFRSDSAGGLLDRHYRRFAIQIRVRAGNPFPRPGNNIRASRRRGDRGPSGRRLALRDRRQVPGLPQPQRRTRLDAFDQGSAPGKCLHPRAEGRDGDGFFRPLRYLHRNGYGPALVQQERRGKLGLAMGQPAADFVGGSKHSGLRLLPAAYFGAGFFGVHRKKFQ